jgi:hypothetical protein
MIAAFECSRGSPYIWPKNFTEAFSARPVGCIFPFDLEIEFENAARDLEDCHAQL